MWSGSPQDSDRADAVAALPEIRRLLLAGKNAEAEKLVEAHFTCAGKGSGFGTGDNVPYGSYQVLGDLKLQFAYPDRAKGATGAANTASAYRRELDLDDAVARVRFENGGIKFEREAFTSAPDEVAVVRLTASRPGAISFSARLTRPERATTTTDGSD